MKMKYQNEQTLSLLTAFQRWTHIKFHLLTILLLLIIIIFWSYLGRIHESNQRHKDLQEADKKVIQAYRTLMQERVPILKSTPNLFVHSL